MLDSTASRGPLAGIIILQPAHNCSVFRIPEGARMELEAEGYRFDRVIDVLPWQHILVFRR